MAIKTLVIATGNFGKFREISEKLSELDIKVKSLNDYPECPEADEPFDNYLENARQKAQIAAEYTREWALADDSGLEVQALSGEPGVYSARYAGDQATFADNIHKLLENLKSIPEETRQAVFRTLMVLRSPSGDEFSAEGKLSGRITTEPRGKEGFGYDPIFLPEGESRVLAEMSLVEKNLISHRTQALQDMFNILKKLD